MLWQECDITNGKESRYSEMSNNLKKIKQDKVKLLIDEETAVVYYGRCVECNKLLTLEEKAYGHDCE
jgi:hypothetical protein